MGSSPFGMSIASNDDSLVRRLGAQGRSGKRSSHSTGTPFAATESSRPNGILISEKTRPAAMHSILDVREVGTCRAGGALGELKIYELIGSRLRDGDPD